MRTPESDISGLATNRIRSSKRNNAQSVRKECRVFNVNIHIDKKPGVDKPMALLGHSRSGR